MSRCSLVGERAAFAIALACIALFLLMPQARAETLESAIVLAYQNNPTLNSQRAATRAADENVPQALSGYRPKVSVTASGGEQSLSSISKSSGIVPGTPVAYFTQSGYNAPYGAGATITQTIFNGFQTANKTRQAEASVLAARETLRVTEQTVLLSAVTAYMNLLRDGAILDLQKRNVEVLQEQLRQTRDRFKVGELTRTDAAQAAASLAAGHSQALSAQATYMASVATYRQVIGHEPTKLSPAAPVDRLSPGKLPDSIGLGSNMNPAITMAQYNVDVAEHQVKVAEGALYPTLSVQGSFQQNFMNVSSLNTYQSYAASVLGQLTIPLYQGGAEYSLIRQAKDTLGQQRINLDVARDQVRQTVVQTWGQLEAAKVNIEATISQVEAAEIALNGIREEARVGQRTTFDVLTALQNLVNARVALVTAQHDRVVASYTLLAAVGRLSPQVLGLRVPVYDAKVHYEQVRDSWAGVR
ncbi:MAG: TolC family outer membrane protein, partial [Pseudolabrys sp.]